MSQKLNHAVYALSVLLLNGVQVGSLEDKHHHPQKLRSWLRHCSVALSSDDKFIGTVFFEDIFCDPQNCRHFRYGQMGTSIISDRFSILFNLIELLVCRVHVKMCVPAGY